jgi:predicted kinase
MIASGKSTYVKRTTLNDKNIICLNDDAIVTMLHGGNYAGYDSSLKVLYKAIEHTIIDMGVALNKTILIDRGLNISIESRKRYIAIAKSLDVECEALWFRNDGPLLHAYRRFISDSRNYSLEYWEKVSKHHNSIWSQPSELEGFSKVVNIDWV